MWYVYIIKAENRKWFYVGSTNRLEERLNEHNSGKVRSTKAYKPYKIVYTETYDNMSEARKREKIIKDKRLLKESILRKIA